MKKVTTLLRGFFLLVCCLAIASLATAQNGQWGQWCYKDYSYTGSAQTFTVPANCTKVTVEAIGGGGAGGYAYKGFLAAGVFDWSHDYYRLGGGGGGAAYARTENQTVSPGNTLTINVGRGGRSSGDGQATTVYMGGTRWLEAAGGKHGQWSRKDHETGNLHAAGGAGGSENNSYYIGTGTKKAGGNGGNAKDYDTGLSANEVGSGSGGGAAGGTGSGSNGAEQAGGNDWAISSEGGNGGGGNNSGLISGATWLKGGKGANGRYWRNDWGEGFAGNAPGAGGSGGRADENHGPYNGGNGGDGFVRVWFYIESSTPLTLTVGTTSTGCPYTLTANATNELFTKNYKWSTGATNTSIEVSPGANTTYTVTVTDVFSGATNTCQITSTASIEVNKCQECGVTIASATASASEVCVGGPSFLSATLESVDDNASYAWSVNNYNAGTNTSLSNYLVTPTSTTTYAIKVTITKGTCTASDTRNITVTVNEKVDPTFASLFNDGYCASTLPAVDDLPTTSDNSITGTWAYSTSDSTYTFTPAAGQCANKFTKKVTISDDPTPGTIEPDIVVCDNQTIYTFNNATSAAGGINGSYAWQVSLDQNTWAPIPNANSAQYAPMTDLTAMATLLDANATGTFYFRRAWTNGCGDVYSNVLSLDNPGTLAPGAISVTGNDAGAYCADATVTATLTANPEATVASPSFTYQWQSSTDGTTWTNISGATASSYNVSLNPVQKISYRYQVKYSSCDWMTSNNTYDITVKELPDVKINNELQAAVSLCAGGSVEVTASGADTYLWSNGGTTATVTFTAPETYTVVGTLNGCENEATVTVTEKALPTVKINGESAYTLEKCAGATVELTATGAVDYTWSPADGLTITDAEHGSTATLTGTGNYTVTGVDANGCSNTATAAITESALPVVNSITAPTDLCPGKTSYELQADITSSAAIDTYTWGGNATGNTATGTVTATLPNCGQTYNYSLKVKDVKGCESAVKTGSFTTTTPTMTIGTISSMEAVKSAENCKYYVPSQDDLNAAVNSAITSTTCGNTVTLSNINPAAGSLIDATTTVTATATDMCGNTETVSIEVTVPTVTFSIDPTTETFTLPYGAATMDVTLTSTPSFEPSDLPYTFENNLQNPLGVGTHNITWTLKDECGNPITTAVEEVNVVLPECEDAVTLDGYDYPVVRVGYDCWFKENVKATTDIADVVAYKNDPDTYKDKFGMLYTWYAAVAAEPETGSEEGGSGSGPALMMPMPIPPVNPSERTQGICPEGWAIPTVEDFQRLFVAAGSNVAYLKDLDATTWTTGKCGIEPSTGFDLRGAGYYLSSIAAFQDLLSNTRFWTDKAGSTANKAICCEFNYYCDEPMFKEISSFDKVSVRCIKINTDLPTPPPTTECPSLGTTVIEIINPVVTGYGELVSATYKATTEIIDYDASKIQSGYYLINAYDGGTPVELEVTGTVSENGLVAELPFDEVVFFNDYTGLTITPVLIVTCENAGGEEMLGEPLTFSDDCPEYTFYNYVSIAPEGIDAHALINHYDVNAIDPNQINWTISSDVATDAPYSFMSSNNTDMDAEYVHIAEIYESNSDRSIQDGLISMNIIHENFPNATTLTFVPSMVVTCDNETRTVIGFPITINLPTYDYTCPTVSSHEFEITLVDGNYTGEIQFEGTNEGTSVSGAYYISPYNQTYGPTKYDMNGDMYNITADNKIKVHIPVNAQGLSGELSEGQSLTVIITIDHGDCGGVSVIGTYEAPAAPVECPMITDNVFGLEEVNSNYYAVIYYEGGSGNETVSGSYHTSSDDEEIDLQLNETLWLVKTEHTITVTIPFANVELEEGEYLYVSLTLSDQGCEDIDMSGEYFEEPEEEPVPECPNTEYTELDLEKVNSYYVQIPYTGGSGNETVSGVYFIGEVMGETNYPLNNQSLVLDKTEKTITVSIPFTQVTLNPDQTIGVVLTLSDGDCNPMTIYCQYTEPAAPAVECPTLGTTEITTGNTSTQFTVSTPVTGLANVNDATSYGYHIEAQITLPGATTPTNLEYTVDKNTTEVDVELTTTGLSVSVDLLSLIPSEYASYLPILLQSEIAVSIEPFIQVTDTACGENGKITGTAASHTLQ